MGIERQLHRERGAVTGVALDRERAAVAFDDFVGDVEPEAGALGLGREEGLEQRLLRLGVHAAAIVTHGDDDAAGRGRRASETHRDAAARGRGFRGVLEQVDEHLLQLVGVVRHRGQARFGVAQHVHAALLEHAGHRLLGAAERVLERARREVQLARVGDVEQLLNDAIEPADLAHHELDVLRLLRLPGEGSREPAHAHADAGERIADLVRDARGEPAERGELVELAGALLGGLERRQVQERRDGAVGASALVAQSRRGHPHRQRGSRRRAEDRLAPEHRLSRGERAADEPLGLLPEQIPHRQAARRFFGEAEQVLRGAIEAQRVA